MDTIIPPRVRPTPTKLDIELAKNPQAEADSRQVMEAARPGGVAGRRAVDKNAFSKALAEAAKVKPS